MTTSDEHIGHIQPGGAYPEPDRATKLDTEIAADIGSSAAQLVHQLRQSRDAEQRGWLPDTPPVSTVETDHQPPFLSVSVEMSDYDDGQEPSGVKISIHANGGQGTEAAQLAAAAYHELTGLLGEKDPADGG
jgi:hypothetical protein